MRRMKSKQRAEQWRIALLLVLGATTVAGIVLLAQCSVTGYEGTKPGQSQKVPELDVAPVEPLPEPEAPAAEPESTPEAPAEAFEPAKTIELPAAAEGPREIVCPSSDEARARFFFGPETPRPGTSLQVVVVSEDALPVGGIALVTAEGLVPQGGLSKWGGPPYAWSVTLDAAPAGTHDLVLTSGDPARPFACASVKVAAPGKNDPPSQGFTGAWPVERAWSREMENLYAAWVARLFLVDPGAKAGWRPLHQVVRDPKRNILYGFLGLNEDNPKAKVKVSLTPDCADTPFFLRAYFSWKLGLPFAMRRCLRGDWKNGPQCEAEPVTNLTTEWNHVNSVVERFNKFVGLTVARTAHSGTVRTVPDDPQSDLYPIALDATALRPGSVFVDPNGHVLVTTRWIAGTAERMGMLLAVDAHPDLTVSHKRFSSANFYFAAELPTGGFKTFRPAVFEGGRVRFMTNAELDASPDYGDRSLDQYAFTESAQFYKTVERLLNPVPLDPVDAYKSQMEALIELLEERVAAVQVGSDYQYSMAWKTIEMPEGGAIFETTGPWEDYSTPARDLRLLLAFDELLAFPRYVQNHRDLFRIPADKSMATVRAELEQAWQTEKERLTISYVRSDRSTWTLTLGQLVDRLPLFEQAYNPNDCPELRWGANPANPEGSTCTRRAPHEQRKQMEAYRLWHQERRRPAGF
ncbi:MAG: hypothetical protein JXB32_11470 [Deltaproteobacteria bacterium]|nr:hypothetical protein [Deltaproteobacteria bacterium]